MGSAGTYFRVNEIRSFVLQPDCYNESFKGRRVVHFDGEQRGYSTSFSARRNLSAGVFQRNPFIFRRYCTPVDRFKRVEEDSLYSADRTAPSPYEAPPKKPVFLSRLVQRCRRAGGTAFGSKLYRVGPCTALPTSTPSCAAVPADAEGLELWSIVHGFVRT